MTNTTGEFQVGEKVTYYDGSGDLEVVAGPFPTFLDDPDESYVVDTGNGRYRWVKSSQLLALAPIIWTPRVKAQLDAWLGEAVTGDNRHSWQEHFQYLRRKISGIEVKEIERGSEA